MSKTPPPHGDYTLLRDKSKKSWLTVKNPPANAGEMRDTGLITELGRSPREGSDKPLKYSGLENSMGREAWQATVYGVPKS